MKRGKLILYSKIITPILTLAYSLYLFTIIFTPKYILNGVISGEIALTYNRLEYYGEKIKFDAFSTINTLIIPAIILSIYQTIISIVAIIKINKGKNVKKEMKLLFSGSLTSISISGLIIGLLKAVEIEIEKLNIDLNYISSAGRIMFGETIIQITLVTSILMNPLMILMATIIQIVMTTISYLKLKD